MRQISPAIYQWFRAYGSNASRTRRNSITVAPSNGRCVTGSQRGRSLQLLIPARSIPTGHGRNDCPTAPRCLPPTDIKRERLLRYARIVIRVATATVGGVPTAKQEHRQFELKQDERAQASTSSRDGDSSPYLAPPVPKVSHDPCPRPP